jgi:uncharacterized membrane protein YgcG
MIKAIYGTNAVQNPMAMILRQADTLQLNGEQADSIATLNRYYTIRLDSIWSPVAKYLASLPENYSHDEAYHQYLPAREATVDLLMSLVPTVNGLLTGEQRRRLPSFVSGYLDTRYLASIRSGTAGSNFGGPMNLGGGGGGPIFVGGGGAGGGGGTQVIIVR